MTVKNDFFKPNNYFAGEVDDYGYAYVPGGKHGVVLLDLRTKRFLDAFNVSEIDQNRLRALTNYGLIVNKNRKAIHHSLAHETIVQMAIVVMMTRTNKASSAKGGRAISTSPFLS